MEVLLLAVSKNVPEGSALLERKGGLDLLDLGEDELVVVLDVGKGGEDELSLLDATLLDEPSGRLRELEDGGHKEEREDDLEGDGEPEGGLSRDKEEGEVEPVRESDTGSDCRSVREKEGSDSVKIVDEARGPGDALKDPSIMTRRPRSSGFAHSACQTGTLAVMNPFPNPVTCEASRGFSDRAKSHLNFASRATGGEKLTIRPTMN